MNRPRLLLTNGVVLGSVAALQFVLDIVGYLTGFGPAGAALHGRLDAIGYTEAHGLALIISVLMILCRSEPRFHWVAAVTHLLLGACNLFFWPIFAHWGLVPMGVLATLMHAVFFTLQMRVAVRSVLHG